MIAADVGRRPQAGQDPHRHADRLVHHDGQIDQCGDRPIAALAFGLFHFALEQRAALLGDIRKADPEQGETVPAAGDRLRPAREILVQDHARGIDLRPIERAGVREVDQHFGAVQRLLAVDVEDADDLVAAGLGDALDGLAHLSIAVQRDLH